MANSITFQMFPSDSVKISDDEPHASYELTASTVKLITVMGDPWVVFETPNYGGDFHILKAGKHPFPSKIKDGIIRSMRVINGGIDSSQVDFYSHSFYKGSVATFQNNQPQLDAKFFSLQVVQGAVIFYDETQYEGEKRILLKGDSVENFTAVKLSGIGKSMKTATDMSVPLPYTPAERLQVHACSREEDSLQGLLMTGADCRQTPADPATPP